jgi:hypothetical protein
MLTAVLITALSVPTQPARVWQRECRYEADRSATVRATSSEQLRLIARAGSLRVQGREGLTEIRVRGHACASSNELLDKLQIETSRSGSTIRIEVAEIDNDEWRNNQYALLDLDIEVPARMAADIADGSGESTIIGLGDITVTDGSGSLHIEDVGAARIRDGSGEIEIDGVAGDLRIVDGSGGIQVDHVEGSVTVEDGSGSIDIADVGGSIDVPADGSGSIDIRGVKGDLTVARKGSGSVSYRDVDGRIDVPDRIRNRRRRRG